MDPTNNQKLADRMDVIYSAEVDITSYIIAFQYGLDLYSVYKKQNSLLHEF